MTPVEITLIAVFAFVIFSLIISHVVYFKRQSRKDAEFLHLILKDHEQFTVQFQNAANATLQKMASQQDSTRHYVDQSPH